LGSLIILAFVKNIRFTTKEGYTESAKLLYLKYIIFISKTSQIG